MTEDKKGTLINTIVMIVIIIGTLKETDDELSLPWGTSFEMSGFADYFESVYEDGNMNGQGTYSWKKGDQHTGEWKNNHIHG